MIQLSLVKTDAVGADYTLENIVRVNRTRVDLSRGILLDQLGNILRKLGSVTVEGLLVARASKTRNMVEVDVVPILGTHLSFNNPGQVDQSLTVLLGRHTQERTKFHSNRTLAGSPLCSKTITSFEGFPEHGKCRSLEDRSGYDKNVVPTTQFRHLTEKGHGCINIRLFQLDEDVTEDLTFTSTATGVTSPLRNTQGKFAVFDKCCCKSRRDVLATRCADRVKEINILICRRLTSLHAICSP